MSYSISSVLPDAKQLAESLRTHWSVEKRCIKLWDAPHPSHWGVNDPVRVPFQVYVFNINPGAEEKSGIITTSR